MRPGIKPRAQVALERRKVDPRYFGEHEPDGLGCRMWAERAERCRQLAGRKHCPPKRRGRLLRRAHQAQLIADGMRLP